MAKGIEGISWVPTCEVSQRLQQSEAESEEGPEAEAEEKSRGDRTESAGNRRWPSGYPLSAEVSK
ncbi:hypothetical protein GCM10017744_022310 [Streptomyces antimycoticus]|uniref:Uncharacterized protein n=1 Tax=Streptomyces antimycoticus TaxID=68175 RepID=A0A4D4KD40_9ACTN|nr:hypothetical protein SANT12839_079730 [Streptomyces antimycoticus]